MESASLRLQDEGQKMSVCVSADTFRGAVEAKDPNSRDSMSLSTMKESMCNLTQGQLNELTTAGTKIFYSAIGPGVSLVFVPVGYLIAESVVNGCFVHGLRIAQFHVLASARRLWIVLCA